MSFQRHRFKAMNGRYFWSDVSFEEAYRLMSAKISSAKGCCEDMLTSMKNSGPHLAKGCYEDRLTSRGTWSDFLELIKGIEREGNERVSQSKGMEPRPRREAWFRGHSRIPK